MINEALECNEPLEIINNIIADSLLDKIINENYINQFISENQRNTSWCWAYSISASIYLATSRIFGRKMEKFENILHKIIELENVNETQERYPLYLMKRHIDKFNLRYKEVNSEQARIAVMKGRQCLSVFYLNEEKWFNFVTFFEKYPKGILTKKIIEQPINDNIKLNKSNVEGHAVVLISIEENCLVFLNSWGPSFGDKGYFRIENEYVLGNMEFIDVFWYLSDLNKEERDYYDKYHLNFIKQSSKFLTESNISNKDLENKKEKCYICHYTNSFKNFKLKLKHNHYKNDDNDYREMKAICPKCRKELELSKISLELSVYLYIKNIID